MHEEANLGLVTTGVLPVKLHPTNEVKISREEWTYAVESGFDLARFNALGQDGYELV